MSQPHQLDLIKQQQQAGKSKEEIYTVLIGQGLKVDQINTLFLELNHPIDKDAAQKKTIQTVAVLGAILIGAGIFSFFASNWQYLTSITKVIIILTAMLCSYSLGWWLKEKQGSVRTGNALLLLGSIIYGSGIFLVGQIFNIRANWPDGLILWMLGVLAIGWAMQERAAFYFAAALGVCVLLSHPSEIFNSFGGDPLLLTSTILLAISTFVCFVCGFSFHKKLMAMKKENPVN